MDITFVSNLMDSSLFQTLYVEKERPGNQIQRFNHLIVEGLEKNRCNVTCYTAIPASRSILKKTIFKPKNQNHFVYSLCINIPLIKDVYNVLASFFHVLFLPKQVIIVDPLAIGNALGASYAARLRKMPCLGIITDLPEYMTSNQTYIRGVYRVIKHCSCYWFLSQEMDGKLNNSHKPYITIEGLCQNEAPSKYMGKREKTIVYAGNINKENGVFNLIQAFLSFKSDYQLIIYGDGDGEEELKKICETTNRIRFGGLKTNEEILEIIHRATLLVNPRPTSGEFTKYSFPSKTLEYMASGTPFASTRLVSIPEEYFQYIYSFQTGSVEEIAATLQSVLNIPESDRERKANLAQEFVVKNKNNVTQMASVISFLKGQYE